MKARQKDAVEADKQEQRLKKKMKMKKVAAKAKEAMYGEKGRKLERSRIRR